MGKAAVLVQLYGLLIYRSHCRTWYIPIHRIEFHIFQNIYESDPSLLLQSSKKVTVASSSPGPRLNNSPPSS